MDYLIDSNVLIDYFSGTFNTDTIKRVQYIISNRLCISVITWIEVLGFSSGSSKIDVKTARFVNSAQLFELTPKNVERTINIRKSHKIKITDAIIAATAIANTLTLLTRNTKDFMGIKGLKVIDPYTLK